MNDVVLNNWANAPALVAAVLAIITLLVYGVGSAWYRSLLGLSLFLRFASLPAVVLFITVRRFLAVASTGSAPAAADGLGGLAFALYVAVAMIEVLALVTLIIERRNAPALQINHRRRKAAR